MSKVITEIVWDNFAYLFESLMFDIQDYLNLFGCPQHILNVLPCFC